MSNSHDPDLFQFASFVGSYNRWTDLPKSKLFQVAFFGRSNSGKSSLLNSITSKKALAKISSTPGKTKSINLFDINSQLSFIDLPGFGFTKLSKKIHKQLMVMIEEYLNESDRLKILGILCDAKRDLPEEELTLIEICKRRDILPILIRSKYDKLNQKEKNNLKSNMNLLKSKYPELLINLNSSKKKIGIEEIKEIILSHLGLKKIRNN